MWEWLLLSADSPLRRLLDEQAQRDGWGADAVGFLPSLKLYRSKSGIGGAVDAAELAPLTELAPSDQRALAVIAGRSLARWSWLGVSDLELQSWTALTPPPSTPASSPSVR